MTNNEMARQDVRHRSIRYKVGWWTLVLIAALSLLNHVMGALGLYEPGEELVFIGYAAVSVYALAVLVVGYRRGERWAWWVTWAFVASYALVPVFHGPEIGPYYMGAAVLMALAQLATWPAFRR
jgi:hypothetical protein